MLVTGIRSLEQLAGELAIEWLPRSQHRHDRDTRHGRRDSGGRGGRPLRQPSDVVLHDVRVEPVRRNRPRADCATAST